MAVSLLADGTSYLETDDGTSFTVSPVFPITDDVENLNVLTVVNFPTSATVETPTGWTRVIEAIIYDDYAGPHRLCTIFTRTGAYSGALDVEVTRTTESGTIEAAIDVYEKDPDETWVISAYESDYEYTVDDITYTGHNVFLELDDVAVVVTAVFNESLTSPGWEITVSGLDEFTSLTLYAQDGSGTLADIIVRGADGESITGTFFAVTDYEFPNFDSVIFRAEVYVDGIFSDAVYSPTYTEVPRDFYVDNGYYPHINSWLRSVYIPELSMPVYIDDLTTRTRSGRVLNKSEVLGQKFPIVTTNVMASREGSFTFHVDLDGGITDDSPRDVEMLLDDGDVLMLHHLDGIQLVEDPTYLIVTNVSRTRVGRYTNAVIKYEVSYIEVERPAPTFRVDIDTWQAVSDDNATWLTVRESHANWLQVLLNP